MQDAEEKARQLLLQAEKTLEEAGQVLCPVQGGGDSWHSIEEAITKVGEAIYNLYKIEV